MKYLLLILLMGVISTPGLSQEITPGKMQGLNTGVREKLVELALQNPELEIADHQLKIAKYNLSSAKGWWAENFSFSFNANEFSLKSIGKSGSDNGSYYTVYPLYNMGISVPIGGIFSKPQAVKAARERVAIAQASRSTVYREIRAQVLSAYEDYLSSQELLTIQTQITESSYNEFLQAQQKFSRGQITLDAYNSVSQQYHSEMIARINGQHNFNLNKIKLETLIGVPLSSVLVDDSTSSANFSDTTRVNR